MGRFRALLEVNFEIVGMVCGKQVCFSLTENICEFMIFFRNASQIRFGRGGRGGLSIKGWVRK